MRILWLTVNRDERVAQLFTPLRKAVVVEAENQGHSVHVTERKKWSIPQIWGNPPFDQMLIPSISNSFDILFTDASFAFMTEPWDEITIPKCVLMEDQHGPLVKHYIGHFLHNYGFNHLFVRYRDALSMQWPYLPPNIDVRWLPHAIDPMRFFNDPTILERDIGLLHTGRKEPSIYPRRHALHEECKGQDWYLRKERPEDGDGQDNDYAALLNSAVMAVQGFSVYNYPTAKTFEIPACGAILVITEYLEELSDLGFRAGYNCLNLKLNRHHYIDETIEFLESTINDTLGIPRREIAQAGHDLIMERHTIQVRAKELIAHFEEIIHAV